MDNNQMFLQSNPVWKVYDLITLTISPHLKYDDFQVKTKIKMYEKGGPLSPPATEA